MKKLSKYWSKSFIAMLVFIFLKTIVINKNETQTSSLPDREEKLSLKLSFVFINQISNFLDITITNLLHTPMNENRSRSNIFLYS
jgi:hypothetical protein